MLDITRLYRCVVVLMLLFCVQETTSQVHDYALRSAKKDTGYIEIIPLLGERASAMVITSVPHSSLLFEKNKQTEQYEAPVFVEMEFVNVKQFSVCGTSITDTLRRKNEYVYSSASVNDVSTSVFLQQCDGSVIGAKAELSFGSVQVEREVDIPASNKRQTAILLVRAHENGIEPVGIGGRLPYGEDVSLMLLCDNDVRSSVVNITNSDGYSVFRESVVSNQRLILKDHKLEIVSRDANAVHKSMLDSALGNAVVLHLPSDSWSEGVYTVEISEGLVSETHELRVEWPSKPRTLTNKEMAVKLLELIVPEDEYQRILEGNSEEQYTRAMNWWAMRDPSPGTEFNEALEAFYLRADFALRTFKSHTKTGVQTDKGKVYILYGEPSSVSTKLEESSSVEVWTYLNQVDRTFTFEKNGSDYTLVEIQPSQP